MRGTWFGGQLRKRAARWSVAPLAVILLAAGFARGDQKPAPKAAQEKAATEAPAAVQPAPPEMTPADIGAFVGGVVPLQLAKYDIAGAVVTVVKDGKVIFQQGYGYADVKTKRRVTPDQTLFRVGSISKLFTWTSVMQQVEQGKLNLDHNVNDYLDFRIPPSYPQPITLRDLMTHTPGFEEAVNDLFVPAPKDLVPLGAYMKAHLPARIFPPGTTPAYSNYGATLAAYIVQRVSGTPFDDYVEHNIFQPLGMQRSSFRQPLPEKLAPMMSSGYRVASEPAGKFEVVQAAPAGSLATTGDDISRFIVAQLQDGEFGDTRILQAKTAEEMHSRQFGLVPTMNGMCLGFYEESRNGHRIFGHGGDTVYFHSDLHLMPDAHLGFFVSYNSGGKNGGAGEARAYLWDKFLDRYFPYTLPAATPPPNAAADAASVAGSYLSSRGWETSFMKAASVLSEAKVTAGADGTLRVDAFKGLNGNVKKWEEIAPMVWRDVDGQSRLAFRRDAAGRWEMVIDFPAMAFFQVGALQSSRTAQGLILSSAAVFLLALLLWPVAALARRHYGRRLELTPSQRRLRRLVKLTCAIELAVLLGWTILLTVASRNPGGLSDRLWPWLRLLQGLGILGVVATFVPFYNVLRSWASRERWWWTRLTNIFVALACVAYLWVVFSLNLLKVRQF
jgi:CubicO group peptidase (beta-lactamase class C family)